MTREDAHDALDAARDGVPLPESLITQALQATGDVPRGKVLTLEQIYARCDEVGDCRIWRQSCTPSGYPRVKDGYAHILAWEHVHGPVPAGKRIYRTCRDCRCCEVEHMVLKTPKQINALAVKAGAWSGQGRIAKITASHRARSTILNDELAAEIRTSSETGPEIEARLGISRSMVSKIRRLEAWAPARRASSIFAGALA